MKRSQRKALFARLARFRQKGIMHKIHYPMCSSGVPIQRTRWIGHTVRPNGNSAQKKFERCVRHVKKAGGPYNPYAVCRVSTKYVQKRKRTKSR